MRSIVIKFTALLALVGWCYIASAQETNISVGAVTKFSGITTGQGDIKDLKDLNEFLNVLESQLAKEFVNHGDLDYLDRMNTEEVFQELHLSSNSTFNASSGALKGLMGRLDFLVVIDSSESSTARIRLIDVESGAVKALETCKRKSSLFGFSQDNSPACIAPFVSRTIEVAHVKRAAKSARIQQQTARDQAAKQKMADEQRIRERDQQRAQKTAQVQAEAKTKARIEENEKIQKQAEADLKAQAELNAKIAALRPNLDDAIAHLSAVNDFWGDMSSQLAKSGLHIRTDVRNALNVANADSRRCQEYTTQRNVDQLQTCISKLHMDLGKLDAYK